jgi:hypothetical protein
MLSNPIKVITISPGSLIVANSRSLLYIEYGIEIKLANMLAAKHISQITKS